AADAPPEALEEYRRVSVVADHGSYDYESRIERVLEGLDLGRELWNRPVGRLSGGQRTRANLGRALLHDSDLYLLDEPTNHLDIAALEWLESYLRGLRRAFIVVAHDRYFLDRVSTRTLELSRTRIRDFKAPYSKYVELSEASREREEREYGRQQEQIQKTEEFVRRFGAGQRSQEAQGRQKRLERLERLERPQAESRLKLDLKGKRRRGDIALRLERLAAGYDGKVLVQCPDELAVHHGAKIALVGPNGSGKTTLARTLLGQLPAVAGSVWWAPNSTTAYFAQSSSRDLEPEATVLQTLQQRSQTGEDAARDYLARFLFRGDDVFKRVGDLSGGEQSRLALGCLLLEQPSFLLLDEPTNHLDIPAREALERALRSFQGTLILISHDRYLIDRVASETWTIRDGRLAVFDGPWSDFVAGRHERPLTYSEPASDVPAPPIEELSVAELDAAARLVSERLSAGAARLETESRAAPPARLEELAEELAHLERELELAVGQWLKAVRPDVSKGDGGRGVEERIGSARNGG
ncbi:MAG TPA: ABC-F family ATP-binding cassette domain-containing protein, partial [Chloroflexota bacterium]|nr:ABC-F family ATP-binding cassette domain-containing protein [Chloroflexota bacterium]